MSVKITHIPGKGKTDKTIYVEEGNVDPKVEGGDIMKAIPKSTEIRRRRKSEEIHPELSKKLPATAKKAGFKCNPCRMDGEERSQHEKHLDDKHGHKCDHCTSSFRTESKLEEHKRISHSFKCNTCNQRSVLLRKTWKS